MMTADEVLTALRVVGSVRQELPDAIRAARAGAREEAPQMNADEVLAALVRLGGVAETPDIAAEYLGLTPGDDGRPARSVKVSVHNRLVTLVSRGLVERTLGELRGAPTLWRVTP